LQLRFSFVSSACQPFSSAAWCSRHRPVGLSEHDVIPVHIADYKVTLMLDHRAMITVQAEKYGALIAVPCLPISCLFPELPAEHMMTPAQ